MIFYPKKQPKKATLVIIGTVLVATVLYALGDLGIGYRAIFQASALFLFAVGIMLMSRYVLTDYKYIVTESETPGGESYFVIVKVSGKREVEMAKFDVSEIYAYKLCRKVKEFEAENGMVDKVMNYTSNLAPADEVQLAIKFNGKKILFRLEGEVLISSFCKNLELSEK